MATADPFLRPPPAEGMDPDDPALIDLMDFGVETEYRHEPPSGWTPHPSLLPEPKKAADMDLWEAAAGGHAKRVEHLAKADSSSLDQRDANGYTALANAVRADSLETVEVLLAAGASLETRDPLAGDTPLTTAVSNNFTEIVRYLVDEGADVNAARDVRAPSHVLG